MLGGVHRAHVAEISRLGTGELSQAESANRWRMTLSIVCAAECHSTQRTASRSEAAAVDVVEC